MATRLGPAPEFAAWRGKARDFLERGVPPEAAFWEDERSGQGELFGENTVEIDSGARNGNRVPGNAAKSIRVPGKFIDFAEEVGCHTDDRRWGLLYRLLWRMTRGGERHLLGVPTDDDVTLANRFAKEIRRDMHKMRAFVRFRKVGEAASGRVQFVSWFEPGHRIVRRNASFFQKRFTGMDWSILTPDECVHWDGEKLHLTPGVTKAAAPDEDELEDLWRGYYKSIFNPARLKLKAMQAEMPVKYWKNLPEAPLIQELTVQASHQRDTMILRDGVEPRPAPANRYLESLHEQNAPREVTDTSEMPETLEEMAEQAACCRACPLWERATQTVFGTGDPNARIMIIGEQPGDQEDLAGKPFVGPAGQLLASALAEAGLDRDRLYLTNAVKHFKWKAPSAMNQRGPRRLHDKANRSEMMGCRPWLMGEITKVCPDVIITLGNTPAQSVIRPDFKILSDRGEVTGENAIGFGGRIVTTVHPSFLLRLRDEATAASERAQFVADLKLAASILPAEAN